MKPYPFRLDPPIRSVYDVLTPYRGRLVSIGLLSAWNVDFKIRDQLIMDGVLVQRHKKHAASHQRLWCISGRKLDVWYAAALLRLESDDG